MNPNIQNREFWESLHGKIPGLLDWKMNEELKLATTTDQLPRDTSLEPNLWMWVNLNLVCPPAEMQTSKQRDLVNNPPAAREEENAFLLEDNQQPHASTSQQPQASTSQQPQASTSQQPQASTSQQPQASTSQQPQASTSQQPQNPTRQQPQNPTRQQPQNPTRQQPQNPTRQQPQASTSQQPQASTSQQPQASTSQQPQASTSQQPQASTSQQPQASTSQQPQASTSQQPQASTSQQLQDSTSESELTEEEEEENTSTALSASHKVGLLRKRQRQVGTQTGARWPRPPLNYCHLIALALKNSPSRGLNVQEIYNFTRQHFPFFQTAPEGWKNTVRHNLCFRGSFEKAPLSPERETTMSRPRSCRWRLTEEGYRRFAEEARALASARFHNIQKSMSQPEMMSILFDL